MSSSRRSRSSSRLTVLQAVCCGLATGGVLLVARHPDGRRFGGGVSSGPRLHRQLAHRRDRSESRTLANAISVEPYRIVSFRRILREATSRGSIRKVVGAFVEALSVWDDVRVHCYIAGAAGGFFQFGSPLTDVPSSLPDHLDEARRSRTWTHGPCVSRRRRPPWPGVRARRHADPSDSCRRHRLVAGLLRDDR